MTNKIRAIFWILLGLFFIIDKYLVDSEKEWLMMTRQIIGIVFVLYGIYFLIKKEKQ